jgi:hypothetical protein
MAEKKKKNEDIFNATELTPLAIEYKRLQEKGDHDAAHLILEKIIIGSTPMFTRLAQYEGYHRTVDIDRLVSAAQSKVIRWLYAWSIKKGPLFSFFSKCSKYAFLSEISKETVYRQRYHVTSDNLESIFGQEDHPSMTEAALDTDKMFQDIFVRWGSPQEQNAIRYLLRCIVEDGHDKHAAIKGAAYAWGISFEISKFFYNWCLMELRHRMYKEIRIPFTQQDLFRHAHSYTPLVDLLEIITWDQLVKLIAIMGGTRLKIPTLAQMTKLSTDYRTALEIEDSPMDVDSVGEIAKNHKRSVKTAHQAYREIVESTTIERTGEHELFPH